VFPKHDVAIATFSVSEVEGQLILQVSLDAEDLYSASTVISKSVDLKSLQEYLSAHVTFKFNGQDVKFKVTEYKTIRDHIQLTATFETAPQQIHVVQVSNTCLIEVPNHSNIIQLDLNGKSRDFRMHKGRTEISVEY